MDAVAIPGTRAAYRRRGYDPVRLLMARARGCGESGCSRRRGLTVHRRSSRWTSGIATCAARSGCARSVAGHRILLIDDVVTTGATLREAARVLREGGAEVVGAAVVASTERRFAAAGADSVRLCALAQLPIRDFPGAGD